MAFNPEDILSDSESHIVVRGVKVRKGTIAAALQNAQIIASKQSTQAEKAAAKEVFKTLAPALVATGVYDHVVWKERELQDIVEEAAKGIEER